MHVHERVHVILLDERDARPNALAAAHDDGPGGIHRAGLAPARAAHLSRLVAGIEADDAVAFAAPEVAVVTHNGEGGVHVGIVEARHDLVHETGRAQRCRGLEQHHDVHAHARLALQPCQRVLQDDLGGGVIVGESGRAHERHLGAPGARDLGDLHVVGGHEGAVHPLGGAGVEHGVREQRLAGEWEDVLPGQALGAAAGGDDSDHAHGATGAPASAPADGCAGTRSHT